MSKPRAVKRDVHGLLLLDKPLHLSSNSALQQIKRLFSAQKAGHTGSLDPLASGMLPICLGEATKFSQYLLDADKYYLVTAQLGYKTSTGDAEGTIISAQENVQFNQAEIESVLAKFRGKTKQIPSMYSALKYQGKPLYELARQGKEVPREARDIEIFKLDIIEYTESNNKLLNETYTKKLSGPLLTLNVHCSKGTYIRNLVEDIGNALGCGAFVQTLRRTSVGSFKMEQMRNIDELNEKYTELGFAAIDSELLPVTDMLKNIPALNITAEMSQRFYFGQTVYCENSTQIGLVKLMIDGEHFIGLGEILNDCSVISRRLFKKSNE